jgi:AraC family transcriptional regulator of adaptative response/methylated-DNA-[protein]-cysteine methyltransferase
MTTTGFHTNDERWRAVLERDPLAEGRFFYGVRTTGIYCRPTCPARRPRAEHVAFFSSWREAEAAGFRPCRKCRPSTEPGPPHADRIRAACRTLESVAEDPPSLAELARAAGLSPYHFQRVFKQAVGVSPKEYAAACRRRRAQECLEQGQSVTETIYEAGYGSSGRFYADAAESFGMSPSRYRRGGDGLRLRCAAAKCWLGWALIAATDRGICSIEFGDSVEALRERLARRFPSAVVVDGDEAFRAWVEEALRYIEAPAGLPDLPLDVIGTAFQQRVWKALRELPAGATTTYTEVAERIGVPSAVRAVASACAANRVGVLVPCHRVLRRDGGLGGYEWGLERKRALLEREKEREAR